MEEFDRENEFDGDQDGDGLIEGADRDHPDSGIRLSTEGNTWVNKGMWGRSELIIIGSLALVLIFSVGYLLFFVNPEKSAADERRQEVKSREQQLLDARARYGSESSTEEQVARLVGSADRFEAEHLPNESTGKTALYQRINNLISANGLINTSGPSFRQLDSVETSSENGQERSTSRLRSIFPGVVVSVTVEGAYPSVRSFLRQLETTEQFIVINSVGLEPSDRSRSASELEEMGEVRTSRSRGDIVSLKIEFAAYFRRAEREMDSVGGGY
jgi:hypothetical protein